MRQSLLFLFFTIILSAPLFASPVLPVTKKNPVELMCARIANMKTKDFQVMVGHRLSLKEKLAFMAIRAKARHYVKKGISAEELAQVQQKIREVSQPGKKADGSSLGKTALIFGIGGAVLLIIGLFVPGIWLGALIASIVAIATGSAAYKRDKSDTRASTGKLLGWITLGVLAVILIAAVILISTWSWW